MADRLDENSLKALLGREIQSAIAYDAEELSQKRARALEYYQGEMTDTPAEAGRSSVVSMVVSEVIGWMLPGIIRVFTASDRMAEYEPVGPEDEEGARQATDYANHVFWKDNPGYRVLWNATHDSLLHGNGIVKLWWDDKEECDYSVHSGLTEEQVAILSMSDGAEIVAQKEGEPQQVIDPASGQPIDLPTFDIKLKRVTSSGKARIECIEPENFLLDADAITIDEARFVAHRDEVTRSDLIEMGFNRDVVDALPAYSRTGLLEESIARADYQVGYDGHEAMEPIELYECYVQADVDGDGKAETVRAYYAGNGGAGELLDWEVWDDELPFVDIPCEPVPHRWDARSVYDETHDIQRVKTVLTRQMLDNLYWVNNPMMAAVQSHVVNPEMLTSPQFGGTVWLDKATTTPPMPLPVPFIGDKALMGLEHFDQITEKRTGVSRSTMALDPEALQNQTATANQNQRDAAYSQIELIARNQAELGWRMVFRKLLKLIVKHQDRPRVIRLRNEWHEMDPRHWNAAMDVTINVGLGTGSRDRDMAMLNNIAMTQRELTIQMAQAGMQSKAVEMVPKIVKTLVKLAESAGIRNPQEYYPEIDEQEIAAMAEAASQPQEDPAVALERAKAELQAQLEREKAQTSAQLEQAKLQAKVQADQAQMERETAKERAQMEADLVIKQVELQKDERLKAQEIQFEREKMAEEARQKELDRELQMRLEVMKLNAQAQAKQQEIGAQREMHGEKLAHDEKAKKHEGKSKRDQALIAAGKSPPPDGVSPEDVLKQMAEMVRAMSAPKRVVRDPDGRAVGVETIQ